MSTSDPLNTRAEDVVLYSLADQFEFVRGGSLPLVNIHYETYGTLNADKSNAIFICHALTGEAHAAGYKPGAAKPGWWDIMIGPGKPVDTDKYFVISPNLLGGCQGSTGPSSINPTTGESYGLDFPLLDMQDFVTVHRRLLAHLGIERLLAAMGGSLGGMQVLQWALSAPTDMSAALIIAASSRLSTQNIAFSAVAREAIMRDAGFEAGHYLEKGTSPDTGLSIARMMAHITYMSEGALFNKFGRKYQNGDQTPGFGVDFAVESYLQHQAEVFLDRFDALSYLYLSRVMDYFDPFQDGDACALLAQDPPACLVSSFTSDWRFPPSQSKRIVTRLVAAGAPVTYREISGGVGHDSFLLPNDEYLELIRVFLARTYRQVES